MSFLRSPTVSFGLHLTRTSGEDGVKFNQSMIALNVEKR